MPANIFLKPAPQKDADGKSLEAVVLIRDPSTGKPLAAAGEWKASGQFWLRRLKDGDVIDDTEAQIERDAQTTKAEDKLRATAAKEAEAKAAAAVAGLGVTDATKAPSGPRNATPTSAASN